jgi:hypothetical protein
MIYQGDRIVSVITNSAAVATAAGVSSMVGRVSMKIGEVDQFAQVNMGRLPCVYVSQVSVDYEFQAEPTHVGTRTSDWNITMLVPTFINRSGNQYQKLEAMKMAILTALTAEGGLGVTDVREENPEVAQMVTRMTFRVSTETSYQNDYQEG